MKVKLFAYSLLLFVLASCQEKQDSNVRITGTVKNFSENGNVILQRLNATTVDNIDTVRLAGDGKFEFVIESVDQPTFYRLLVVNRQVINLIVDKDDIVIEADGNLPEPKYTVTGSKDMDFIMSLENRINAFEAKVQDLNQLFVEASQAGDNERAESYRDDYMEMLEAHNLGIKSEIEKMGGSLAALQALSLLNLESDFTFIDNVYQQLKAANPNSPYLDAYGRNLEEMRPTAVGQMAPEINLPTPEGDAVKLSSLRGNYVLIDFWAAWCKPCRMENPNVVRMYEKYNDKGFEIYGVSLDRKKEDWVKAIADDGLTWTQVSDLQYFNSAAAATYKIQAIPATILLDKEGRIIAKNLRGKQLEDKLAELFGG